MLTYGLDGQMKIPANAGSASHSSTAGTGLASALPRNWKHCTLGAQRSRTK